MLLRYILGGCCCVIYWEGGVVALYIGRGVLLRYLR